MKKLSPLGVGLFGFFAPVPVLLLSTVAVWLLFFGVGLGLLGYETIPDWFTILSVLPALLSMLVVPAIQILGIVLGIMKRREKHSILCIVLSALGLVGNSLMWAGVLYAGMHF